MNGVCDVEKSSAEGPVTNKGKQFETLKQAVEWTLPILLLLTNYPFESGLDLSARMTMRSTMD